MQKMNKWVWGVVCVSVSVVFAAYVAKHPMDFRVYHYGARGVFDGTRPVYGPSSGLGWPMHYRYPPLFLLLFAPLASLPLAWGAAVWVVLKIAVLERFAKSVVAGFSPRSLLIPLRFITPYRVEEFR